jgi:hypothetical protein
VKLVTALRCSLLLLATALLLGCAATTQTSATPTLPELRSGGPATSSADFAGRWLLGELISTGGDARHAAQARSRLDQIGGGDMVAHLARGLDDSVHGRLRTAPTHYLRAVKAARGSEDPRAPFVAWFAAHEAVQLSDMAPGLWKEWKPFVTEAMTEPVRMGWRARAELVEWWVDEEYDQATKDVEELAAAQFGCVKNLRLAGPFGRGTARDVVRHFAAESPGPWPQRWQPEPGIGEPPHMLKTDRHGCQVFADEPTVDGVYYTETFLQLRAAREVLIAVQGAMAVWVDDQLVIDRDPRRCGSRRGVTGSSLG